MQIDASRERRATGRLALVYDLLADALGGLTTGGDSDLATGGATRSATDPAAGRAAGPATAGRPIRLLDCGGGSGTFAVPLAVAGADVTVVDISADALATLQRRAREANVSALIHPVQGDVESLGSAGPLEVGGYDAVLAHGILEAVDDVQGVFAGIAGAVRPGGLISVLIGNPAAVIVGRALAGELDTALQGLRELNSASGRLGPDVVVRLCASVGFVVESRRGIGVFSDLVPGSALDSPGAHEALAALDADAADRAPFADLAGRVHLIARRPQS